MLNLSKVAEWLGSAPCESKLLTGVSIDSRRVTPGVLFVAIKGEVFDGHDFALAAVNQGAAGVVTERFLSGIDAVPQFVVKDTVHALAILATKYRELMSCRVIALTGSTGKTTVKEMIASILPEDAYATRGNLNNHLGVPLCVLELTLETPYAVFELGANHAGEIAYTVDIVKPDVALVNNVGAAHLAGFGSLAGVAKAKGEIYQGLANHGTAILNADEPFVSSWENLIDNKKVFRFSRESSADLYAKNIALDSRGCARFDMMFPDGETHVMLRVPGLHQVSNALAAAACAYGVGLSMDAITKGLNRFTGVSGRMTQRPGLQGSSVIDDTYNANPRSTLAAIEVLSHCKGQRIFVLGDMGELGDDAKKLHEDVGHAAKTLGIDKMMTTGQLSVHAAKAFGSHASHYENQMDLVADLKQILDEKTTILVKGSRSSRMENVVREIVCI